MPGRRTLTAEEKERIRLETIARERVLHPKEMVRVHVSDETDDQGKPLVKTVRIIATKDKFGKAR